MILRQEQARITSRCHLVTALRGLEIGTMYDGRGNDIDFGPAPNTVYVT